jgi:hypothetical protein
MCRGWFDPVSGMGLPVLMYRMPEPCTIKSAQNKTFEHTISSFLTSGLNYPNSGPVSGDQRCGCYRSGNLKPRLQGDLVAPDLYNAGAIFQRSSYCSTR